MNYEYKKYGFVVLNLSCFFILFINIILLLYHPID